MLYLPVWDRKYGFRAWLFTVMLKSSIKGLLVNMDQVTKVIVSFMELKVNKWIRWRVEGEVCPDTNPIFIIWKDILLRTICPFFI